MSVVYQFKGIRGREVTRRTLAHAQRKEKERGGGGRRWRRDRVERGEGLFSYRKGGRDDDALTTTHTHRDAHVFDAS